MSLFRWQVSISPFLLLILVLPLLLAVSCGSDFDYRIQVQDNSTGQNVSNAEVIILVSNGSLEKTTDDRGIAIFHIPKEFVNLSGQLVIQIDGEPKKRQNITLKEGILPDRIYISLEPKPTPTSTPTSTPTPSPTPTSTPTPSPTLTSTPTLVPFPTPVFSPGNYAEIVSDIAQLLVYDGPGEENEPFTSTSDGVVVTILLGPEPVEGINWWSIRLPNQQEGWVRESNLAPFRLESPRVCVFIQGVYFWPIEVLNSDICGNTTRFSLNRGDVVYLLDLDPISSNKPGSDCVTRRFYRVQRSTYPFMKGLVAVDAAKIMTPTDSCP